MDGYAAARAKINSLNSWSGVHALPCGDESPVRRAMGVLICNTSAVV